MRKPGAISIFCKYRKMSVNFLSFIFTEVVAILF